MSLDSFTPVRFTDSTLFLKEIDGQKLLIKTFINEQKEARRELELEKNLHWSASGFRVPGIIDIEFREITEPYVVMEFIDGINLSDYLKNPEVLLAAKLEVLGGIFKINYRRHLIALGNNDLLLIHTDPNTDNIIIRSNQFFFIDFEHFPRSLEISAAVAKEVATFARRVVRDLGIAAMQNVVEIMLVAYNNDALILDKVEELTLGRSFQWLHRLKNNLKKRMNAKLVTRYDIIETIRLLRAKSATP